MIIVTISYFYAKQSLFLRIKGIDDTKLSR